MMNKDTVIGIFTEVFSYIDNPDDAMKLTLDLAKRFDLDGGKPQPRVVKTERAATKPSDAPPEPRIDLSYVLKHSKLMNSTSQRKSPSSFGQECGWCVSSACQQKLNRDRPCTVDEFEQK